MIVHNDGMTLEKTFHLPVRILSSQQVDKSEELLVEKAKAISFRMDNCAHFYGTGASILLDFGRELCGGVRLITREAPTVTRLRLTFGESVTEACSTLGEKNACNDHSPRDFEVVVSNMSDLEFGQTGFRFVRIELLDDCRWDVISIYASCTLPAVQTEMTFRSSDPLLDKIVETALYTVKLCCQNGYIWDGIKRDRLVWCGDMHPEILSALYGFGQMDNIPRSLDFLRDNTPDGEWINALPSYNAWWIVCLCDYVRLTGDTAYFEKAKAYACQILRQYNAHIDADGTMRLPYYFLDWPTAETEEAKVGTALLIRWVAQRYLAVEDNLDAAQVVEKLTPYLSAPTAFKQVRSFQVLYGEGNDDAKAFLEAGGGQGMSTFMSYYILMAAAKCGSDKTLDMLKEYYGGMLSRGATTFWEDFDLAWLEGSGRIDEFTPPNQTDLHSDYGRFCYTQLRHSLCHGWSAGVLAFIVEHIVGLQVEDGFRKVSIRPHGMGLTKMKVTLPTPHGVLSISIHDGIVSVNAPDAVKVNIIP